MAFFFENMRCMYFIKRGLRVFTTKAQDSKPQITVTEQSQTKASYTARDKEKTTELLARGQQRPERPETGSHAPSALKPAATQSAASSRIACRRTAGCREEQPAVETIF